MRRLPASYSTSDHDSVVLRDHLYARHAIKNPWYIWAGSNSKVGCHMQAHVIYLSGLLSSGNVGSKLLDVMRYAQPLSSGRILSCLGLLTRVLIVLWCA